MSFKTYESKHDRMKDEWNDRFGRDLKKMIQYYKKEYPSI